MRKKIILARLLVRVGLHCLCAIVAFPSATSKVLRVLKANCVATSIPARVVIDSCRDLTQTTTFFAMCKKIILARLMVLVVLHCLCAIVTFPSATSKVLRVLKANCVATSLRRTQTTTFFAMCKKIILAWLFVRVGLHCLCAIVTFPSATNKVLRVLKANCVATSRWCARR